MKRTIEIDDEIQAVIDKENLDYLVKSHNRAVENACCRNDLMHNEGCTFIAKWVRKYDRVAEMSFRKRLIFLFTSRLP